MATRLNAGDVKRSDLFRIDPANIAVDPSLNARHFGHTPEGVKMLALSIARDGQKQPAAVRRVEDAKVELVSGYGRHSAVLLINRDTELRKLAGLADGENMRLMVTLTTADDTQAFVDSIIENAHRNATSPVDDAHNIRRLVEDHGYSWERVADIYPFDKAWAQRLYKKLLSLSVEHQLLVHEGKLPLGVAMDLSSVPVDERDEVVKNATDDTGKVRSAPARAAIRDSKAATGAGLGRNIREVRKVFEDMKTNDGDKHDEKTVRFARDMLCFIQGKVGEQGVLNAIERVRLPVDATA